MKAGKDLLNDSITAAAAVVAHRFIGIDGNYCGANLAAWGVSELATALGEQIPTKTHGIAVVEAGGIITAGDKVTSDSTGRAVTVAVLAAAAPVVDVSKLTIGAADLTIDSGATPVTSSAANGDIISATAGAIDLASGFLAAPVLSGGVLPVAVNGMAQDAASGAGVFIRVRVPF